MQVPPSDFIERTLSPVLPPENPLLRTDWAAIAFDRNLHQALAPDEVWTALLSAHATRTADRQRVGIITYDDLHAGCEARLVLPRLRELQDYWSADAQFLHDHYIFSPSCEWVARLDQDVTLFAGEARFLSTVVEDLGGLEPLMQRMMFEFDPGPDDSAGLARYLESITAGLRMPIP